MLHLDPLDESAALSREPKSLVRACKTSTLSCGLLGPLMQSDIGFYSFWILRGMGLPGLRPFGCIQAQVQQFILCTVSDVCRHGGLICDSVLALVQRGDSVQMSTSFMHRLLRPIQLSSQYKYSAEQTLRRMRVESDCHVTPCHPVALHRALQGCLCKAAGTSISPANRCLQVTDGAGD